MLHKAIEIYMGRTVDFTSEVIMTDNSDGNDIQIEWNIQDKTKPTQEEIENIILTSLVEYSLNEAKKEKINELNISCTKDIYSGFESNAKLDEQSNPITAIYPFEEQDQDNMTGLMALLSAFPTVPIYWKAKDELISYEWTAEEFKQLCEDAYMIKLIKMQKFHILRQQVLNCTSIEDLSSIAW